MNLGRKGTFESDVSSYAIKLANIFNYVHFQDGTVFINFKHPEYNTVVSMEARPLPCTDGMLTCQWISKVASADLETLLFDELLVSDGLQLLSFRPALKHLSSKEICFLLSGEVREARCRSIRRHRGAGIQAEMIQNGTLFKGSLRDFSSLALSVDICPQPPQTFHWIDEAVPVYLILKRDDEIVYSGDCEISRHSVDHENASGNFVLKPRTNQASRFKSKGCRSQRCQLVPPPSIYFDHPLSGATVNLECDDLSGSGVSVQEYFDNSVLLPGLNIKELNLELAPHFNVTCKGQVVYSQVFSIAEQRATMKCGITFLDMPLKDQATLAALVQRANNKGAQVCNKVDLDSLWKFFFEVGFVYPDKYAGIHSQKEEFKQLYKKIYIDNPDLARHFIVQDRGEILAHISMVHTYERTWLMHHHAASKTRARKAGITVLAQISEYVNNFHLYYSSGMQYIISYYRTENRFPERVFGGFHRHMNNQDCCSVEPFSFFHLKEQGPVEEMRDTPHGCEVTEASSADILELYGNFAAQHIGTMLKALDLAPNNMDMTGLNKKYEAAGLMRERKVYSLKLGGALQAVISIIATGGLNLSNLTNCIKVFIVRPQVSFGILHNVLLKLSDKYGSPDMPVLLYPVDYAVRKSVKFEKIYNLWVLDIPKAGDNYLYYMKSLTERPLRNTHEI